VDQYFMLSIRYSQMAGRALSEQFSKMAGGPEKLEILLTWAKANLAEGDRAWYNSAMEKGLHDESAAVRTFEWLLAKYGKSVGAETGGKPMEGNAGAGAVGGFASSAEMHAALLDPKYKTDADFREHVRARMMKTADKFKASGGPIG